jgi:dihydroflavonol-4-reductase
MFSTESILTRARQSGPIDEDVEVTEADALGPYCLSKLRAENAAKERAQAGRHVVIANPTMPVGPGDRNVSPPTRLIRDFCRGRLPARMDCSLNLIDVRDVALGLSRVLELGVPGRRYLLGGENLTLIDLLTRIGRLASVAPPAFRVPYAVGLAIAHVSEAWADWVTGSPPKATVTGVRLTRRTMHFDPSRTQAELQLTPRPINDSLADAVNWLRETHQIPQARLSSPAPHLSTPATERA